MECSSAQTNSRNEFCYSTEFAFAPPATPPLGPALWYGPGASAANGKASRRYYRGGLRLFALKVNARNGAPRGSTCTRGPELRPLRP